MKSLFSAILTILVLTVGAVGSDEVSQIPHEDMEFDEMAPYVHMSTAHGDMKEGAHGTIGRMKADSQTPKHTHNNPYHGVVISGTMIHQFEGEDNPPKLTAGSYWYVPADKMHFTKCYAGEDCIFYIHADEKFDIVEMEEE